MTIRAGALMLALSSAALPNLAPVYPELKDGYDYRYGIKPGTDLAALAGKPEFIAVANTEYYDAVNGEKRLSGYVDFHGVYDVGIEFIGETLVDFEAYPQFMPWITGGTVLSGGNGHYDLKFTVGITMLGIKLGYVSLSESRVDALTDGALGLRSRMRESPDGSLFEHYLSWFFLPVTVNGRQMTYVRYYTRPGLRNPSWVTSSFVKRFTESNVRDQVSSFMKESGRRQKNAQKK